MLLTNWFFRLQGRLLIQQQEIALELYLQWMKEYTNGKIGKAYLAFRQSPSDYLNLCVHFAIKFSAACVWMTCLNSYAASTVNVS